MTSLLTCLALLGAAQGQGDIRVDYLLNPDKTQPRTYIQTRLDALPTPKLSPKKFGVDKIAGEFDWLSAGYVRTRTGPQFELRFRVYSQERKQVVDTAFEVNRMLLRLWDMNWTRLGMDNPQQYHGGIVDVYLSWGGKPGGEQMFVGDVENNRPVKANNIYFYDLASFTNPLEMAREVAHEFGHATLPAVGGYRAPEYWANGYLGEKLYMSWVRDLLASGQLVKDDFMFAPAEDVQKWVASNVDPLVARAAAVRPTQATLSGRDAAGMDAYLGLVLYMSQILPDKVFARTLKLMGSQDARDYPAAVLMAIEEPEDLEFRVPGALKGKSVWVPVSKGTVSGAKVLKIEGGWAQVELGEEPPHLKPRR